LWIFHKDEMKTVRLIARWICGFLAWCLFFFWWKEASTPGWVSRDAVVYSLLSIAAVIGAAVLYSTFWILHNKRIARRGRRGKVSFYKSPLFETDALGRKLVLPAIGADSVIVIRPSGSQKEYVVEKKELGAGAGA
jgi:hypothetical protein